MGILDDAIRQHLELKRKHGASGEDLERLEKEAFGPPARPGDPEFESDEEPPGPAFSADSEVEEPFDLGSGGSDWSDEPPSEEYPAETQAAAEAREAPEIGTEPGEMSAAERARLEYADLGETADHPTVTDPETGEEPLGEDLGASDEGAASDEPPETTMFDQDEEEEDFGDLDLDLSDLDEEEEGYDAEPAADDPRGYREPETGEDDREAEDSGSFEADEDEEDQLEDEDEDLLEETPDFLEDAPEGERLWFEQGEPKDFDFDD